MKTTYLNPDNRRIQKGKVICCKCNKALTKKDSYRYVLVQEDETTVIHPDHYYELNGMKAFQRPIGSDCAGQLGLEWSVK